MAVRLVVSHAVALAVLTLAACSGDGGARVRDDSPPSGSGSGAGSGSGPGSGSASGLSRQEVAGGSDDPLVTHGVRRYREYVLGQAALLRTDTKRFTDAVRGGDLAAARASYASSRVRWERIEPIAGLVEDVDRRVDARVDDFAGLDDPAFTGWHRLEHLLFAKNTTRGGAPFADRLDADLAHLQRQVVAMAIPPRAVALGAGELIEEVSKGRSAARRTATPAPICGTSRRTSTERRRPSTRCARR